MKTEINDTEINAVKLGEVPADYPLAVLGNTFQKRRGEKGLSGQKFVLSRVPAEEAYKLLLKIRDRILKSYKDKGMVTVYDKPTKIKLQNKDTGFGVELAVVVDANVKPSTPRPASVESALIQMFDGLTERSAALSESDKVAEPLANGETFVLVNEDGNVFCLNRYPEPRRTLEDNVELLKAFWKEHKKDLFPPMPAKRVDEELVPEYKFSCNSKRLFSKADAETVIKKYNGTTYRDRRILENGDLIYSTKKFALTIKNVREELEKVKKVGDALIKEAKI